MDRPSAKYRLIHEVVSQEGNLQNVKDLCRIARVSRSGYYNWLALAENALKKRPGTKPILPLFWKPISSEATTKGSVE